MPRKANPIYTISRLYDMGLEAMSREIERINLMSIGDHLPERRAKDLRDYLKLLKEMKMAHAAILVQAAERSKERAKRLSDAELAAKVNES